MKLLIILFRSLVRYQTWPSVVRVLLDLSFGVPAPKPLLGEVDDSFVRLPINGLHLALQVLL